METRQHASTLLALIIAFLVSCLPELVAASPVMSGVATTSRRPYVSNNKSRHAKHRQTSKTAKSKHSRYAKVGTNKHHRYRSARRKRHVATPRYAYPLNFFLLKAPEFDTSPFPAELSGTISNAFLCGVADHIPSRALVRSGIALHYPMRGGIFFRREPVKYVVLHSTETGIPLNAKRVIDSWSSGGRRHAGAQYVVDRDGTIFQAVDPDLAAVHLNIFKTLKGINNDNSIGIEMVRSGRQNYPSEQRSAVIRLTSYLQDRYKISDDNVITHCYAQQGDHTDPVAFNWDGFLKDKLRFRRLALAQKMNQIQEDAQKWWQGDYPVATTYLQTHGKAPEPTTQPKEVEQAPSVTQSVSTNTGSPNPALELRGPIDIDPKAASLLNSPDAGQGENSQ